MDQTGWPQGREWGLMESTPWLWYGDSWTLIPLLRAGPAERKWRHHQNLADWVSTLIRVFGVFLLFVRISSHQDLALRSLNGGNEIRQLCWYKYKRHQTNCSFKRSVIAGLWPWDSGKWYSFSLRGNIFDKVKCLNFIIRLVTQNFSCNIPYFSSPKISTSKYSNGFLRPSTPALGFT